MKLVIAEKPSVAQAIAHVLGATARKDGYTEGGGWLVSWCVGHLVGLAQGFPEQEGQGRVVAAQPLRADWLALEMFHPPADLLLGCTVGRLSGHLLEAAN